MCVLYERLMLGFPAAILVIYMKRNYVAFVCLAITTVIAVLVVLLRPYTFALWEPAGQVASSERALIIHAVLLMLIIVVPVFILAFTIAWKYRASNTSATYTPDWEHSKLEEFVWWVIPLEIILVIGALTWSSTHQLDPYKPLTSPVAPLTVQVVALEWKWLFIYPSLGIASVNMLEFPANTPITFEITSDAPMNSFWIPQLGGQIYAMTGMVTKLNLIADMPGTYAGSSANYSGDHFADMKFDAKAVSEHDFTKWVEDVKSSGKPLTMQNYSTLAAAGTTTVQTYAPLEESLYNSIVMQFMSAGSIGTMHMNH